MSEKRIKELEDKIDNLEMNQDMIMKKLGIKEIAEGQIKFQGTIKKE